MSRSYKKAIIKDRCRNKNPASVYWKPIRHRNNQIVRAFAKKYPVLKHIEWDEEKEHYISNVNGDIDQGFYYEDLESQVKDPRSIINDYDRCDYIVDYEYTLNDSKYDKEKIINRRK